MTKTFPNGAVARYDDDGKLHADDQPAVTHPDGTYAWFRHGKCHRDNGLPAVFITTECLGDLIEYWDNGVLVDTEAVPSPSPNSPHDPRGPNP